MIILMREKGFAPIILIIVLGIPLLSVGALQAKTALTQKLQATLSSNLSTNSPMAGSSDKLTAEDVKSVEDEQKANPDMIIISGKTPPTYGENIYRIYIPKKGGNVTGTVSGNCNGNITGTYDGKNLGAVSGSFAVNCHAGPGSFFKVPIKSDYEGKVDLTEGKISLAVQTTEPVSMKGWFELPFTPTSADQNPGLDNKDTNFLVSSGDFHFSGNDIPYRLSVPKKGGPVTGTFGGICQGVFEGNFNGGEGGKIEGSIKGKCKLGPVDLIKMDVEIRYSGTVKISENKVYVIWQIVKPISGQRGDYELSFDK